MFDDLPLFSVYALIVVELYLLVITLEIYRQISLAHNTLLCAVLRFAINYCLNCFPYHALRGATDRSKRGGCLDYWRRGPSLDLGLKF